MEWILLYGFLVHKHLAAMCAAMHRPAMGDPDEVHIERSSRLQCAHIIDSVSLCHIRVYSYCVS